MRKMMLTIGTIIVVVAISAYVVWVQAIREEPMSQQALADRIGVMYDAEPTFKKTAHDVSYYTFTKNGVTYEATVDRYNGRVQSLAQQRGVYKADDEASEQTQSNMLTDEEAIRIAKRELKGEVDALSYRSTSDGGYYLIEIDSDTREAVFQIHALSGEILSVTWDD